MGEVNKTLPEQAQTFSGRWTTIFNSWCHYSSGSMSCLFLPLGCEMRGMTWIKRVTEGGTEALLVGSERGECKTASASFNMLITPQGGAWQAHSLGQRNVQICGILIWDSKIGGNVLLNVNFDQKEFYTSKSIVKIDYENKIYFLILV